MPVKIVALANKPYRPSNGTEGEIFMGAYCEKCAKQSEDNPCPIAGAAFFNDIDADDYPEEWTHDAEGWPTCTAFELPSSEPRPPPRCKQTIEMDFGDGRGIKAPPPEIATHGEE